MNLKEIETIILTKDNERIWNEVVEQMYNFQEQKKVLDEIEARITQLLGWSKDIEKQLQLLKEV